MAARHSELLQLKNLGMASVNILHAIGVRTYADLEEQGAVRVYQRILERKINVSKVMLYALQGAWMDVHWNDLDRKSTRLNSSHVAISYAVFCLKKKINN